MRFSAVFIACCMVVIAASLGAAAYLLLALSPVEAAASALTVLSLLAAYNAFSGRAQDRAEMSRQITELSRGTTELAHQVGDLARRVTAAETATVQVARDAHAMTEPLGAEIEALGALMTQIAESVAAHEMRLVTQKSRTSGTAEWGPSAEPEPAPPQSFTARLEPTAPAMMKANSAAVPEMLAEVRAALAENRVDLYLQPIVSLPQRKIRFYEALARLRTEEGRLLTPADYVAAAESGGLMPALDNLMLLRAVQVVRRLSGKNREVALFCSLSESTLADAEFFPQFFDFLSGNRELASTLTLQFSQSGLRAMGAVEKESLAQLAGLGFRFALDRMHDLALEPRQLAEQGFRFIRTPAALLLDPAMSATADIHPSDLSNLLARHGIDLIAERIETESTVVDLLDYEVRFAQGTLFASPRPVRSEVFQAAADRAAASADTAPELRADAREPDAVRANRRREPEASPRPGPERSTQGLVNLARDLMRRA